MNKRLRKKLYRGEFRERCFEVGVRPAVGMTESALDSFAMRAILWGHSRPRRLWLGFGGCFDGNNILSALVGGEDWEARGRRGRRFPNADVTEQDREDVIAWLREQPEVAAVWAGCLFDPAVVTNWWPEIQFEANRLPNEAQSQ